MVKSVSLTAAPGRLALNGNAIVGAYAAERTAMCRSEQATAGRCQSKFARG